jgi:LPXTG-motif cell wall-anchored protein
VRRGRFGWRRGAWFGGVLLGGAVATVLSAGPALAASVSVADFRFAPGTVTIQTGQSVTWTSSGPSPHTVTADDSSFDSGNLNPGQSFSHTFAVAGTYHYHCQYHVAQGMVGTVIVQAATTTPPPSSSPPASGGTGDTPPTPTPTPTPLPNTGLGTGWFVAGVGGLGLVIAGAVVLFGTRRRSA